MISEMERQEERINEMLESESFWFDELEEEEKENEAEIYEEHLEEKERKMNYIQEMAEIVENTKMSERRKIVDLIGSDDFKVYQLRNKNKDMRECIVGFLKSHDLSI